jgi:hypothetical protein
MALVDKTRKLLHRKRWENVTPLPVNTAAGSFVVSDKFDLIPNSLAFFMASYTSFWRYDGDQDSYTQLPNSGMAGVFGAGACGEMRMMGALGGSFLQTCTGGAAGEMYTNKTIVRDLGGNEAKPVRVRVIKGTGLGFEGTVRRNLVGANSTIYLNNPDGSPATQLFDATTQFQIFSGSIWVQGAGAAAGFAVWDLATSAWTQKAAVGVTWATDGKLTSTIGSAADFLVSTSTGENTTTTLNDTSKAFMANQWANYQVHITGGTGKGQIRGVVSNTATQFTVDAVWDVTPDATSVYSVEGNYDNFYLVGNFAVTLYRYKVSTNTWTTLAPSVARAGNQQAGGSFNWLDSVPTWELESDGKPLPMNGFVYRQNGRYLLSFRGGATNALDLYDIAANTWISNNAYGNQMETFTTGSSSLDYGGFIYMLKEGTGRISRFNVKKWQLEGFATNPMPQGTVITGNKLFMLPYKDGGVETNFLYVQRHTGAEMFRIKLIDQGPQD